MTPETWETWQVIILMGFAGWAGFGACTLFLAASNADDAEGEFRAYRRGLVDGSGLSPAELRLALGNIHDLGAIGRRPKPQEMEAVGPDPDPMAQPDNWGAQ